METVSQLSLVCHDRDNQGGNSFAKTSGGTVEVEAFQLVLGHLIQYSSQKSKKVSQQALACYNRGNQGGNNLAKPSGGTVEVEAFQLVLAHPIRC